MFFAEYIIILQHCSWIPATHYFWRCPTTVKKTNDNEVDPQKLTEKRAIKIENGDTVTFMAILHQQ